MEEIPKNQPVKRVREKDLTAILSYLGILFLVPLLVSKDNPFAQFHAKQVWFYLSLKWPLCLLPGFRFWAGLLE